MRPLKALQPKLYELAFLIYTTTPAQHIPHFLCDLEVSDITYILLLIHYCTFLF